MQTVASLIPDSVSRILRNGYSEVTSSNSWWKTGIIVGITTGSVITGTYLLFRLTSSDSSGRKKSVHRNGTAFVNRHSSTPDRGRGPNGKPNRLTLPVTSRARTALEFEDATDGSGIGEVDGGFLSTCITTSTPRHEHHSFRRRNDSITSGTTTLMITTRSPPELLLYGLESLKRSIRLFEEARNKLVMSDESFGSASRENSTDSELEFILCKAKQLQDDLDSYLKEAFPDDNTLVPDIRSPEDMNASSSGDRHLMVQSPVRLSRHDSTNSLATTITMPFYDIEPNLHFFKLYTQALDNYSNILEPRTDRWKQMSCDSHEEFIAKVQCMRMAFGQILEQEENRQYFSQLGQEILEIVLSHSPKDPTACLIAYQEMLDYVSDPDHKSDIMSEVSVRNIPGNSFYDLVLDYMILESFDDLANPPSAVTSVANNRWLSSGFRELALQTAVSAVLKHKKSKLPIKGGFFDHFYNILEHVSPILAWGFLGSDIELKLKCNLIKDAIMNLCRSYFSFDRVRYTSLNDLTEDILRVTDQEYENLQKQLNSSAR